MLSRKGIKIFYPEFYWVFSLKSMYLSKNDVPEVIICNFPRLQWIFVKKRILKKISFKDVNNQFKVACRAGNIWLAGLAIKTGNRSETVVNYRVLSHSVRDDRKSPNSPGKESTPSIEITVYSVKARSGFRKVRFFKHLSKDTEQKSWY